MRCWCQVHACSDLSMDKYIVVYAGIWSVTYVRGKNNPGGTVGLGLVLEGSHRGLVASSRAAVY